ncbi:hypothetical protein BDQ17DRAFT_1341106 [Cyathus striatus]|nr:hypothetical protein BDQ17DRAFT_1341106 [Cyathus striatus]
MDPPQSSRPSFSEGAVSSAQGPIPLFDTQLRFLNDSYLVFFQERKRIEDNYVDSLRKLYKRMKSVDASLDERSELSTTRSAWSEVLENVDREAQTRNAFCATLTTDIINPLTALKEIQERTRKRIKEDLKESGAAYNEYAETMLPKLKSKYTKKFQDVEEQKKAAAAQPGPVPSSSTTTQDNHNYPGLGVSRPSPSNPTRPVVTAPQPLRALDRRPSSGSAPGVRNRSPSSSTAFSDLAHQGKKQLNQLIGFLDKSGSVKDSLGGRENQALRTVRAKRDADEADREYRKGVHWLETLRLRRTKILESGYKSLEMFVVESSQTVRKSLEKYTDNMIATSTTQTQLASHARSVVDKISPEKDVARLKGHIPRSLASAIPDPILYQHGQVGSCNDLIFGFSLVDYATSKGLQEGDIPKIIKICIEEIDKRGLDSEGIYRVSGRHAVVQALQHAIEKDEDKFQFDPRKDDVYAVASLLKLYLRELPEPVFKFPLQDRIQHSENLGEHSANNFLLLRSKMRRLPAVHQATLKAAVEHLWRVAAHSERNKMDPKNLAIVFGGVIFGEDEMPKGGEALLSVQSHKDSLMEDLIINAQVLFDDNTGQHSPPLPPTPVGEPVPAITYGSKTTKVSSLPPPPSDSVSFPTSVDFTPRLPARPAGSIHPSSRIQSPTARRFDLAPPSGQEASVADAPLPPSPSTSSIVLETGSVITDDSEQSLLPEAFPIHSRTVSHSSQTQFIPPNENAKPPLSEAFPSRTGG